MQAIKSNIFLLLLLLMLTGCPFRQNEAAATAPDTSTVIAETVSPTPTPPLTANSETRTGENAESLKPSGWFVLTEADGDIDGDGGSDLAVVYSRDNPQTKKSDVPEADGEAARLFVIARRGADGKLTQIFSSSKVILCRNCSGMLDNLVPELKIVSRKVIIDQNVLATSDVDYHLEIAAKGQDKFLIVKGSIKTRARRTGKKTTRLIKPSTPLEDFDINSF